MFVTLVAEAATWCYFLVRWWGTPLNDRASRTRIGLAPERLEKQASIFVEIHLRGSVESKHMTVLELMLRDVYTDFTKKTNNDDYEQ